MATTSYNVKNDGVQPMSFCPSDKDHDRLTTHNGHGPALPTAATNVSPNHISHTWETDDGTREQGHCHIPLSDSTDIAIQNIMRLLHELRPSHFTRKAEPEDACEQAQIEWQLVAMVADRVMLVMFTALVLVVCAVLFGRAPT